MTEAEIETPEAAADEMRARKQAHKEEKLARKLARQKERVARVAVCQEREMDAGTLARLLEEMAAGVRAGSVSVKDDELEAVLAAAGPANVRVKARLGRKRMRLSVRIVWTPGEGETPACDESDGT